MAALGNNCLLSLFLVVVPAVVYAGNTTSGSAGKGTRYNEASESQVFQHPVAIGLADDHCQACG
jgi:hypothetical protein